MADDRHRREYPPHVRPEDQHSQLSPRSRSSLEEARHATETRGTMAASVTLPSIQDPHGANYSGQPPPSRGYPPDPRYASPNGGNEYPPPGQSGHPPGHLPPLQSGSDHRSPAYPPEHRSSYYDDRRPPQYTDYPPDYYYRQGGPPPNGYPRDYRGPPPGSYPPDFGQGLGAPMAQAAPRQRTSIACRYCRKRKVGVSHHESVNDKH